MSVAPVSVQFAPLIRDLAIILAVAGLISLLFQRTRQPVVLGYIIAGILVGPYTPPFQLLTDIHGIQTWAELGVIFLMFTLGLEFSFRKLSQVGVPAGITASVEVLGMMPLGFCLGKALGWSSMDSLFLGAMLSISSTTIIIKALDELKLKKNKFAELIFAVLIVEDLFAILLLVGLGTLAVSHSLAIADFLENVLKLILVVGGWFLAGYFVVPRFMRYVGKTGSNEMLTILSLSLCLALVVFAHHFHYSTALGAFIMGSILAESSVLSRIEHNMASLRDLFGAIFFVSVGMLIDLRVLWEHLGAVVLICAATILGKIVSTGMGALLSGQNLRTSVQAGFGLAQIGEFSFIMAQQGAHLKVTSAFLYPIAVAVSLVTTFTTPYLMRLSGRAASLLERGLPKGAQDMLHRYAEHIEARRQGIKEQKALIRPLLRWSLSGLTASVIFVLCFKWVVPSLENEGVLSHPVLPILGWGIAIILASPFIWAMLTAFQAAGRAASAKSSSFSILGAVFKLLTLLWMIVLSAAFFPGKYIILVLMLLLIAGFALFYRQLECFYRWFERQFLSTFKPQLREGEARFSLGRGGQLDRLSQELETPFEGEGDIPLSSHYDLKRVPLEEGCPFIGQTIQDTGIREHFQALILCLERRGFRNFNPDAEVQLQEGDVLWIVGEKAHLQQLMSSLMKT